MTFWQQVALALAGSFFAITGPILGYMWLNRQQGKKDGEIKHEQNQQILANIQEDLRHYPPHEHLEREGPLCFDGIRLAPRRNGTK